jgi:hypothetical protein
VGPVVKYTKTGDFNIAYQVLGDGPVDLLLLPGWITHLELQWDVPPLRRFLERLAGLSRLILFDNAGTGLVGSSLAVRAPPRWSSGWISSQARGSAFAIEGASR